MVGSSKILTVSYGTFSCTLEGFDDSFGTMKAIAEYFRDLAADDRYFGAEPPVPDAQMLARIAEREVARRVEARLEGTGVTLRTGDALPQPLAAVMQAAPEMTQAAAPDMQPDPAVTPQPKPVMRQVISRAEAAAVVQTAVPVMPPVAVAPLPPVQPMMSGPAPHFVPAPPRVAPVQTTRPTALLTGLPQERVAAELAIPFSIPAHPDADSVAAKLQRIRAVVGRGAVPATTQEFAEDLGDVPAMPDDVARTQFEAVTLHSLSAQWADLDETADTALTAALNVLENLPEPDMAFDMNAVTSALGSQNAVITAELPAESVSAPVQTPVRARVIRVRRADFDTAPLPPVAAEQAPEQMSSESGTLALATTTENEFAALDDLSDMDGLSDLLAMDGAESDLSTLAKAGTLLADLAETGDGTLPPEAEADLLEELAALERDAILTDDFQGFSGTAVTEADDTLDPEFSIANVLAASAEMEPAPAAPLADVDADDIAALFDMPPGDDAVFDFSVMSGTAVQAEIDAAAEQASSDAEVTPLRLGRDLLEREPEADAEAMDRIMSQTDAELNSPENSRRREAISQIKAAVAATQAERLLGEKSVGAETDDVESAFRDDLKQVVRPRRPVGEVSPDLRSERPRPAPLKLVASQRIDIPQPRPAPKSVMPVRPRRVSVQDDQEPEAPIAARPQAGSFAEFAASMGATELPDLLEAAAAYTSFIEGVEDFSRPQLMKKVQDMVAEEYSREDGLRSFGTLLRQGRIMKTSNGRFVVSEDTRFNPERKSA